LGEKQLASSSYGTPSWTLRVTQTFSAIERGNQSR
jgi:hypothetical protein